MTRETLSSNQIAVYRLHAEQSLNAGNGRGWMQLASDLLAAVATIERLQAALQRIRAGRGHNWYAESCAALESQQSETTAVHTAPANTLPCDNCGRPVAEHWGGTMMFCPNTDEFSYRTHAKGFI